MTAETLAPPRSLRNLRTGVIIALAVAAIDVIGMIALGLPNAPVEVNVITTVLAIATGVGAIWAWRGATWGVWVVAVSRFISALSIVPIIVAPEAPKDAIPVAVAVAALTGVAIVLLFVGLAGDRTTRRRARASA